MYTRLKEHAAPVSHVLCWISYSVCGAAPPWGPASKPLKSPLPLLPKVKQLCRPVSFLI